MGSKVGLDANNLNRLPTTKFTVLTNLLFWNKTPRHLKIGSSRFGGKDFETSENDHPAAESQIAEE